MEPFIADLRRRQEEELVALAQKKQSESARIEGAITIMENSLPASGNSWSNTPLKIVKQKSDFSGPHFRSSSLSSSITFICKSCPCRCRKVPPQKKKNTIKVSSGRSHHFFRNTGCFTNTTGLAKVTWTNVSLPASKAGPGIASQTIPIAMDKRYCTPGSFTVATILANKRLEQYLQQTIRELSGHLLPNTSAVPGIKWTDTRAALEEMTYAFYFKGSFNNGQVEIKKLYEALCLFSG